MDKKIDKKDDCCHQKKSKFSWLTIILLLTLLLLIIGGYLVFFSHSYNKQVSSNKIGQTISATTPNETPTKNPSAEGELKKAVTAHLHAIQNNDLQTAYDMTTKEFKNATSFDAFQAFVNSLPIITQFKTIDFENAHMENNAYGKINAILKDSTGATTFEFVLLKTGTQWRVFGVRMVVPEKAESLNATTEEIRTLITAQLSALHSKDISTAYYAFTSMEFQKSISLEAFKAILEKFPGLTSYTTYKIANIEINEPNAFGDVSLKQEENETRLRYGFTRENGKWKVLSLRPMLAYATPETEFSQTEQDAVVTLLTDQLRDIKAGDAIKAYYAYSSKEFQDSAPVEQFVAFLKTYPFLLQYKDIQFNKGHKEDNLGVITATISSDKPETGAVIEYLLIQENNKWKIFSMEVVPQESIQKAETPKEKQAFLENSSLLIADAADDKEYNVPYFNSEDLQLVIESQLKALRKQDFSKAYYGYTSKEFQGYTSFDNFKQFVQNHPFLFQNVSFQISKFNLEDDVGTFNGSLINANKDHLELEYRLIFQDGKWKILAIELKPSENSKENANETSQNDAANLDIPQVVIGTKIDANGIVTNGMVAETSSIISANREDLYINVYVAQAPKGTDISLALEHVNTGSKVPSVSMKIEQDIETATLSFIFTPPAQGWPKGNYKLQITSSTGIQKDFPFTIR